MKHEVRDWDAVAECRVIYGLDAELYSAPATVYVGTDGGAWYIREDGEGDWVDPTPDHPFPSRAAAEAAAIEHAEQQTLDSADLPPIEEATE